MVFNSPRKLAHFVSKLFQPISVTPKNAEVKRQDITSKSQKLMLELGIIKQASPGCFHFLPLGVRCLEKLIDLVDEEMTRVGGQKIIFPSMTSSKLWKLSGRLETVSSELFTVKDRHEQNYILSPTHEEVAAELLGSLAPISHKQLPLKLYQITSKFRDEMKPRFGLIRGKQFIMKDMYSFDVDLEHSKQTYDEICKSYSNIFNKIGIEFTKVLGTSGHMGGDLSHEYHYKADIGEDKILTCPQCNYSANVELTEDETCPKCKNKSVDISCGIEVGHIFLLGEKYSKPFKTMYLASDGKPKIIQMGSYGLGLSRIIAAVIEVLSNEHEIRWPSTLAPYKIVIIPPKSGSKEELHLRDSGIIQKLYTQIGTINSLNNDILVDDRTNLTIGRRYLEAKRLGYPYIIALGKKVHENPPLFEFTDLNSSKQLFLSECDLLSFIRQHVI